MSTKYNLYYSDHVAGGWCAVWDQTLNLGDVWTSRLGTRRALSVVIHGEGYSDHVAGGWCAVWDQTLNLGDVWTSRLGTRRALSVVIHGEGYSDHVAGGWCAVQDQTLNLGVRGTRHFQPLFSTLCHSSIFGERKCPLLFPPIIHSLII